MNTNEITVTIDLTDPTRMRREERALANNLTPCALCGRGIVDGSKAPWVGILDSPEGYNLRTTPGPARWFQVGPTCAKKFAKKGAHLSEEPGEPEG